MTRDREGEIEIQDLDEISKRARFLSPASSAATLSNSSILTSRALLDHLRKPSYDAESKYNEFYCKDPELTSALDDVDRKFHADQLILLDHM